MIIDLGSGYTLSSERAASSHGVPVLVFEGRDYGPADILPCGILAGTLVKTRAPHLAPEGEPADFWRQFIRGPWGKGVACQDLVVYQEGGLLAVLTWESSKSTGDRPVLRLAGKDYTAAEVPAILARPVGEWVQEWAAQADRTDAEREAARRFLGAGECEG